VPKSEYLAVGEAAALVGVSVDTLRRWERAGQIKAVRTPTGQRRFKRSDVEALLREGEQ
jgi:excisionase family DNA binding protein